MRESERERDRERVCVCVREREKEREREREREREKLYMEGVFENFISLVGRFPFQILDSSERVINTNESCSNNRELSLEALSQTESSKEGGDTTRIIHKVSDKYTFVLEDCQFKGSYIFNVINTPQRKGTGRTVYTGVGTSVYNNIMSYLLPSSKDFFF